MKKEEKLKINELSTHHEKSEKDQQNRYKESRSNKGKGKK